MMKILGFFLLFFKEEKVVIDYRRQKSIKSEFIALFASRETISMYITPEEYLHFFIAWKDEEIDFIIDQDGVIEESFNSSTRLYQISLTSCFLSERADFLSRLRENYPTY